MRLQIKASHNKGLTKERVAEEKERVEDEAKASMAPMLMERLSSMAKPYECQRQ